MAGSYKKVRLRKTNVTFTVYVHSQLVIIFMLPSYCTVLHYVLDAQAFLQPQREPIQEAGL